MFDYSQAAMPFDADDLADKYGIRDRQTLEDTLLAVTSANYSHSSPHEDEAPLRRVFGLELLASIYRLRQAANDAWDISSTIPYTLDLACIDVFGAERAKTVIHAVNALYSMPERDAPHELTLELASAVVMVLAHFWHANMIEYDGHAFRCFVEDALMDRWAFPQRMLLAGIDRAAVKIGRIANDDPASDQDIAA